MGDRVDKNTGDGSEESEVDVGGDVVESILAEEPESSEDCVVSDLTEGTRGKVDDQVVDYSVPLGEIGMEKVDEMYLAQRLLMADMAGEKVGDITDRLEKFALEILMKREESLAAISEIIGGEVDDSMLEEVLKKIPPEAFHSSLHGEGMESFTSSDAHDKAKTMKGLKKWLGKKIEDAEYVFTKDPEFVFERVIPAMMKTPRFAGSVEDLYDLNLGEDLMDRKISAYISAKYSVLFLLASRRSLDEGCGARVSYMMANIAVACGKVADRYENIPIVRSGLSHLAMLADGAKDLPTINVPTPFLALFEGDDVDKEDVRKFINSFISLIFPNIDGGLRRDTGLLKNLVQEDFIYYNLMALSKKHGLYEEYSEFFIDLFKYRQVQYVANYHLYPCVPQSIGKDNEKKISILKLVTAFNEKYDRKPIVASLGCGNGFLENFLLKEQLIDSWRGVDIDELAGGDSIIEEEGKKVIVLGVNEEVNNEELFNKRIDRVFDALGSGDIIFLSDVIHEVEKPMDYLIRAFGAVNPEGVLFLCEPTRCRTLDHVSSANVHLYDGTRFPTSMLTIEDYLELYYYLEKKGAGANPFRFVPGNYAGYNDPFWRGSSCLEKLSTVEYVLPDSPSVEDWDEKLTSDEQIFDVWPISCIESDEDKRTLLSFLQNKLGCEISEVLIPDENGEGSRNIKYSDVKRMVIKWLVDISLFDEVEGEDYFEKQENAARLYAFRQSPYSKSIDAILRKFPDDDEIGLRNHLAGEVYALELLFREMGIKIESKIRNYKGWGDIRDWDVM